MHHNFEYWHWGMHWIWWILLIFILIFILMALLKSKPKTRDSAMDILRKRLAKGEIDRKEYEERKRILNEK